MKNDLMQQGDEKFAVLEWDINETQKKSFIENLAPIVLFTYNRLEHTQQTVEALQKNVYAKESDLFIYSDGAKKDDDINTVNEIRNYLHTIDGFKSVKIIERIKKWGLARNIIDGVTKIVNEYGKIIVLEDDIVTSKYFLKYMNDALAVYKNESRVMMVSGYMFPVADEKLTNTYFLPIMSSWGWATWKRSWDLYERNPEKLVKEYAEEKISRFNLEDTYDFWRQVTDNYDKTIHSWAIFAYEMMFRQNGVCLFPSLSLVHNVGFDNSGVHCGSTQVFDTQLQDRAIDNFTLNIQTNNIAYSLLKDYFLKIDGQMTLKIKKAIDIIINDFCDNNMSFALFGANSVSDLMLKNPVFNKKVEFVVDNYQTGFFNSKPIVTPKELTSFEGVLFINVINPVYVDEIEKQLKQMHLTRVRAVTFKKYLESISL